MICNTSKSFTGARFGININGDIQNANGFWSSSLIPGICTNVHIITICIKQLDVICFHTYIFNDERHHIIIEQKQCKNNQEIEAYVETFIVSNAKDLPENIKNQLYNGEKI